jgi:dienelactone hydrolase
MRLVRTAVALPLVALALVVAGCSTKSQSSAPTEPIVVPPDASGLALRPAGGVDVRYGADHTTIAIGDFNGDGQLDLAVALCTVSKVGLFFGSGDGTFAAGPELETGSGPWKVAAGDFNGDGKLDLITANQRSGSITVLLGNGDGTFQPKVDSPAGTDPGWVEVGDLDGDGRLDAVVAPPPFEFGSIQFHRHDGSGAVGVLLGHGDGTFGTMANVLTGVGANVVAIGDLDGDHKLDIVAVASGAGGLSVLLGKGDGTFAASRIYASGPNPRGLALGDLNGDGKIDAVAIDFSSNILSVLLGRGDGTLSDRAEYRTATAPVAVAIGDVDGDGRADVVYTTLSALDLTSVRGPQEIGVFFGKGDGTFRGALHSSAGVTHSYFMTLADLDGDGRPELAVTNLGYLDWLTYPAQYFPVGVYRLNSGTPLTVSPPRAGGVSPGDVPISFAASAGSVARDVSWSLSPAVGTLSNTTGSTVRYTPPATVAAPQVVQLIATYGSEAVTTEISLSNQVAWPLGSTSAPNGFLEYLPPGYDDGFARPLLVFLQGAGGNGNGTTDLTTRLASWAIPAMLAYGGWPADYPFIVLSPQHPGNPAVIDCPSAAEVAGFVTWAIANYRVDPKQVYLTGLSCGSSAAWDYIGLHTDSQVAAAVLLVGSPGAAWNNAGCNLGRVAIWALHGSLDNPGPEQAVMSQLLACPAPPRRDAVFTLIPGGSHYIFDDIYLGRLGYDVFDWLLAHPKP